MTDATMNHQWWGSMTQSERSLSLWMPRILSAENEYGPQREIAKGRARDMAINSAYGANAVRIHRDNVIGPSFTLALRINYQKLGISQQAATEWSRGVERDFGEYANSITFDCDAQRVQTFPWLLHTAYAGFLTAGECLGVIKWKPSGSGYNTCLLLVEPERLSMPLGISENKNFRRGIETDDDGAPLAYHIRVMHPTDPIMFSVGYGNTPVWNPLKWERVPRATPWGRPIVLHMLDRDRPDMRRGLSQFISALRHMKMVDAYDQAELESAILQASFAAVIKTNLSHKDAMGVMGADLASANDPATKSLQYMQKITPYHSEYDMSVSGAKVTHLLPGEELDLVKPESPGLSYEAFQTALVRKLAAATGTSAESLSRDFSKMSFASAKMSLNDVWRHFMRNRELVVRQIGLPFVAAWLEEAIDSGRITLPSGKKGTIEDWIEIRDSVLSRSTYMSWGAPMVDPVKEVQGKADAIRAGLSTLQQEAYAEGRDWEEDLEQIARERERMKALGIPLPEELNAAGQKPPPKDGGEDNQTSG